MVPEFWDPVTGSIRRLSYRTDGQHTVVPLALVADGSGFVVFREATSATFASHPAQDLQVLTLLIRNGW